MIFINDTFDDLDIGQENITTSDSMSLNFHTNSSSDPINIKKNV